MTTTSSEGVCNSAPDPLSPPQSTRRLLVDDPAAVGVIVALLAQGLELIYARVANGIGIVRQDHNVPQPMQEAQSFIGRLYLEEGKIEKGSADLHELIALCTKPLDSPEWGLAAFSRDDCVFRHTVLVDPELRVPTRECGVIAASYQGFGEHQIFEQILFEKLKSLAIQQRDSASAYSALRELLGRHSVISSTDLVSYLDRYGMLNIQADVVREFYQPVPEAWLVEGVAYRCEHCRALMKPGRRGFAPKCSMVQCATMAKSSKPILLDSAGQQLLNARAPILKYWTEPAIDELRIYDTARELGIADAALYPFHDAVDISILPDMAVGIDVKSYSSPEILAMKFIQSGIGGLAQYREKIVAITDACVMGEPDYIKRMLKRLNDVGLDHPARDVRFLTVGTLLNELPIHATGA